MLVQINGKRFNRSALVQVYTGGDTGLSFGSQGSDISAIPSIAIKNLQVLRDGATAQYGSDAIAGVMNFGMRNDRNNLELQARYGQTFDHGHTKLDSGRSRQIAGTAGIGIGETGFIDVAGEWYKDDGTSPAKPARSRPFRYELSRSASQLPHYPLPVKSGAHRPSMAGREWSTPASTSRPTANSIHGARRLQQGQRELQLSLAHHPHAVDVAGITHTLGKNGAFSRRSS